MIADGDLKAEPAGEGFYRWTYITVTGAEYVGGRLWKTKAAALRDGRGWLAEQGKT